MQAPGGGVAGGNTMQGRLQSLISPLRLPVGLGMVSRRTVAPIPWQKARQTPEVNWGPRSETMFWGIPWHMVNQQVRRFSRGWEFGQGNEMHHLGEPVNHGQDGVVAPGGGKAGDKI